MTAKSRDLTQPPAARAVLWLEGLLALGAFGGAAGLLTGAMDLGAATADLPWGSTTLAGWALLVVNGLLPTGVLVTALRRHPAARTGHVIVGMALGAWITVQVAFLGWPPHWVQITYFMYGMAIMALAVPLQHALSSARPRKLAARRRVPR